jgi:nitrogen regulatory protein P-II 1
MIEAILRPSRLDEVKGALVGLGVGGMTVTDVRGVGHQPEHSTRWAGTTHTIDLLPRTQVEVVVPDRLAEAAVKAVSEAARTGSVGDGMILVLPVSQVIRIRSGETGEAAI